MNQYLRTCIISLVLSGSLALWLKAATAKPLGFEGGPLVLFYLLIQFLIIIGVPLLSSRSGQTGGSRALRILFHFGICLLIGVAVTIPVVISARNTRKVICEENNARWQAIEERNITNGAYSQPMFTPDPCN